MKFMVSHGKPRPNRSAPMLTCPLWIVSFVMLFLTPAAAQSVGIRVSDAGTVEGHSGTRTVEVSVFVSPPPSSPVSVSYATRSGSAGAADFTATSGSLTFAKGETQKKISVAVVGERAVEGDEKFDVVLSNSTGVPITRSTGSVTIVNDDFATARSNLPAIYEVRFTFSGHTGSLGSAPDCPVRRNGKIVMSGLLNGFEGVQDADDIVYTGVLQFDADVDMCETTGEGSDARLCSITTKGSGPVKVELTVNFADRGAYIKAEKAFGFDSAVYGSCDSLQVNEERQMYPDKSMSMIFNGLDLPLNTTKLEVGRYRTVLKPGEVIVEVLSVVRP